jgi:hypothetical protein
MGGCVGKVSLLEEYLIFSKFLPVQLVSDVFLSFYFGQDRSIVEDKLDFKGGNVHVITTKEDWDQKVAEANKDGKIVSKMAIRYRDPCFLALDVCTTWCLRLSLYTVHEVWIGLRSLSPHATLFENVEIKWQPLRDTKADIIAMLTQKLCKKSDQLLGADNVVILFT